MRVLPSLMATLENEARFNEPILILEIREQQSKAFSPMVIQACCPSSIQTDTSFLMHATAPRLREKSSSIFAV